MASSVFLLFIFCLILAPQARSEDGSYGGLNSMMNNLKLEGDASIGVDQMLQLTKNYNDNVGHVWFPELIHLWDKSTNKLANFDTIFDFIIDGAKENSQLGDGLAFFLAPPEFAIPQSYAAGGYLALFHKESAQDPSQNKVVAIEIDTVKNDWDLDAKHIGIDVGSIKSVATQSVSVDCNEQQFKGTVKVQYDSSSKKLKADMSVRCNNGNVKKVPTVSYNVDLRLYLPEFVKVGFSAATSSQVAFHRIAQWSFNSNLS